MPQVDGVNIGVGDMAKSLAFYRLLGFDLPSVADKEGYVTLEQHHGFRLSWNIETPERVMNPGWRGPACDGRIRIVLRCASCAEVDAIFQGVVAAGHTAVLEPFDAPWGARHCRVLDPDGTLVDLFAAIP